MSHLFQALAERVDAWRTARYDCPDFPAIREILDFAIEDPATGQLRYLRHAQFRALETYWYLRLVLNTPRIPDLYATLFPKPKERREAMGLTAREIVDMIAANHGPDGVTEMDEIQAEAFSGFATYGRSFVFAILGKTY